jgi:indole-3-glycerol phosphate synthase
LRPPFILGVTLNTLEQIIATVRARVERAKAERPLPELAKAAKQKAVAPGFRAALLNAAASGTAVIAELKKASPSRGVIREDFDVAQLAEQYKQAGAAALSVLTEETYFKGSLEYLQTAARTTGLPCLRKDFIVDEYQLHEAKLYGASAVLLIVAALDDATLAHLHTQAKQLSLEVLVEVHSREELQRAVEAGADIIGVNSRDLKTLEVHPRMHEELAPLLPKAALKIAESGIGTSARIAELKTAGYQAFLVGESLMKASHPGQALAALLGSGR